MSHCTCGRYHTHKTSSHPDLWLFYRGEGCTPICCECGDYCEAHTGRVVRPGEAHNPAPDSFWDKIAAESVPPGREYERDYKVAISEGG